MNEAQQSKWQPMMVVIRGGSRLECACGALAVIVIGNVSGDHHLDNVDYWCQSCYLKEQTALAE